MLANLPELSIAQGFGLLSFALGIACFYQKRDRQLKIMLALLQLNNAIHFVLMGAIPAALGSTFSLIRTGVALKTSSAPIAYIFIVLTALVSGAFVDVWWQWFSVLGACIGTYAVFCLTGIRMRIAFLMGACCWLTNNILIGSIGGTMLEGTLIVVNLTTIARLYFFPKPE